MLNGKFFTGLPPKMIDRNPSNSTNRQESHFYWPDDAQAKSALETRQNRRTSQQQTAPRIAQSQPQFSIGENEVDTKQMFQKEFSKSSIQFYDNLQDSSPTNNNRRTRSNVNGGANTMKREITCKPTAVKLDIPVSSDIDDDYALVKKKQTFASKIQFYDYIDEQQPTQSTQRNNASKPRMNFNDKHELEKNLKNSPKLQSKRSFASSRDNLRENSYTPERDTQNSMKNTRNPEVSRELHERANAVRESKENGYGYDDDDIDASEVSYSRHRQFSIDREHQPNYQHEKDKRSFRAKSEDPKHDVLPKRILKTTNQNSRDSLDEFDELNSNMSKLLLAHRKPTPRPAKKHVHYVDDYDDEEFDEMPRKLNLNNERERVIDQHNNDYDDDDDGDLNENFNFKSSNRLNGLRKSATLPNMKAGNTQRQQSKLKQQRNERTTATTATQRQYMETGSSDMRRADMTMPIIKKSSNNLNNKVNNNRQNSNNTYNNSGSSSSNNRSYLNNSNNNRQPSKQQCEQHANESDYKEYYNSTSVTSSTTPAFGTPKHLRSSLCFNDGAIIADNSKTTMTPTAQQTRRNARSSATQRVSVGLPD